MEREAPKLSDQLKSRFGFIIFFFRLAAIPFKMKRTSTIYTIYTTTAMFSICSTFLAMLVDMYKHRDNLDLAITNIGLLIPLTNFFWLYFYCRYVINVTITVPVSFVNFIYMESQW